MTLSDIPQSYLAVSWTNALAWLHHAMQLCIICSQPTLADYTENACIKWVWIWAMHKLPGRVCQPIYSKTWACAKSVKASKSKFLLVTCTVYDSEMISQKAKHECASVPETMLLAEMHASLHTSPVTKDQRVHTIIPEFLNMTFRSTEWISDSNSALPKR